MRADSDDDRAIQLQVAPLVDPRFRTMVALVMEPADSTYSLLPNFEAATRKLNSGLPRDVTKEKILSACKDVVDRHGLADTVGIDLKHTHFGMPAGQVLAEVQDPWRKESRMWPQAFTESLTPFAFALIDGNWQPYEFVADCEEAKLGLVEVQQKPDFLKELATLLQHFGVQDILGFHVLRRTFLEDAGVGGTMETPGEKPEELLLRPNSPELQHDLAKLMGQSAQVMWMWGRRGHLKHGCGVCVCFHCGSHCKGHK
ncbi:unnamed protein product [Symbiodinium natans]|uniref:Uncharacterized protein n=1 Tax=Symbiodinium natans TaxID=878477 RepID=A0A812I6N9_9DINO|nr:unnamed protein product [Symbiodinium natans]